MRLIKPLVKSQDTSSGIVVASPHRRWHADSLGDMPAGEYKKREGCYGARPSRGPFGVGWDARERYTRRKKIAENAIRRSVFETCFATTQSRGIVPMACYERACVFQRERAG